MNKKEKMLMLVLQLSSHVAERVEHDWHEQLFLRKMSDFNFDLNVCVCHVENLFFSVRSSC